jgi:PST family polysaccharide transporter
MKGLEEKTLKNVFWSGFGQFSSFGLRYVILLVLAWVLTPAAIGLESLASVVILLAGEFGTLGFESALIQGRENNDVHYNTAFWASLFFSLLIAGLIIVFTGGIAVLLGDQRTEPLLRVLSITLPFQAAAIIPGARLSRALRFKARAKIQFSEQVVYGVTALVLAFAGAGVWSLIWSRVFMMVVRVGLMLRYEPWRPSFSFEWSIFKEMISFSFQSLTSNILNRGFERVDYFLVGRFLGTQELGYYTLAAQLAVVPVQRLVGAVQRVAFPALALVQDSLRRIRTGLLLVFRYLLLLLIPYALFLLVFSLPLIESLYGQSWLPAVPLMQILGITGLFTAFDASRAGFFARGRPGLWTLIIFLRFVIFAVLALLVGLAEGAQGVAVSLTLAFGVTGMISVLLVGRLLKINVKMIIEHIWRPAAGGVMIYVLLFVIQRITAGRIPVLLQFTVIAPGFVAVYIGFVFPILRELFEKLFASLSVAANLTGIEQVD